MEEQRLKYTELAPEAIAAMRALEHFISTHTSLGLPLLELVRLRASLLNGCEYCIGLHSHEAAKRHETPDRIAQVADWRTTDIYTHREQAAFAWTEVITNIQDGHAPPEAFDAARLHFSEAELVNLTIAIASINMWNRMAIAFRAQHIQKSEPPKSPDAPAAHDGGKISEDEEA